MSKGEITTRTGRAPKRERCLALAKFAIHDAVIHVRGMGSDVRLTEAVRLLGAAKGLVSDTLDWPEGPHGPLGPPHLGPLEPSIPPRRWYQSASRRFFRIARRVLTFTAVSYWLFVAALYFTGS